MTGGKRKVSFSVSFYLVFFLGGGGCRGCLFWFYFSPCVVLLYTYGCVGPGTAGKRGREGEKKKSGVIHESPFFSLLFSFSTLKKEKKKRRRRRKKMVGSFTLTRGAILQMNPAPTA